ncbi:hypothetical protein LTS08_002680 [Lithohypha guttulata]|uniref:uncharacterized protein n=1 Tax=Lithohypha guttulata TaxID=1690604 RepID=UPI002DE1C1BE|nr:hypothetical protein LTR51_001850 [Lithohypha guttulata]KAK5104787.1 hypothetical protein LTS08_002680 [Lithohypha guttulata]
MRRDKVFVGVMGVTGAGKSTFIKAATDDESVVVGHELTSCTTSVCPYTFTLEGKEVVLIDTPGFNDTFKSEAEVLKEIASFLGK